MVRSGRTAVVGISVLVLVAGAVACGGPDRPPRSAATRVPDADVSIVDAAPGWASAVAVSSRLFRSAPAVVVAAGPDRGGVEAASGIAERIGVPVLLAGGDGPSKVAMRDEVARLSPEVVIAVGAEAAGAARSATDVRVSVVEPQAGQVPSLPDDLPRFSRPSGSNVLVLAARDRDDSAAAATTRAAGGRVVLTRDPDPRADDATGKALRSAAPDAVIALGSGFGPVERLRARLDVAAHAPALPGGGHALFPGRRLVCLYGHPGTPSLGVLGEQGIDASIERARSLAAQYQPLGSVPVVPTFEIIATVAQGSPGPDGDYSAEAEVAELRPWVERAGEAGLYVVLDLQPGRADLLEQAKRYEPLLRSPHVGLAVDAEWKLGPDQVPLKQIGSVDAAEVNRVTTWLADLTASAALPQKLLVVHQFRSSMIRHEKSLTTTRDEVAVLVHMDGQGAARQKDATWRAVVNARPDGVPMGWKNFYDEDKPMATPERTLAHDPEPVMISYQ